MSLMSLLKFKKVLYNEALKYLCGTSVSCFYILVHLPAQDYLLVYSITKSCLVLFWSLYLTLCSVGIFLEIHV